MNRDTRPPPIPDAGGRLSLLEDRAIALLERWLGWSLPPGVGWAHTLGSVLLTLLGLQALTGLVLALYYCPSLDAAWESIRYIDTAVVLGSVVRGLHSWGASALVVFMALHMARVFWWGAYRPPRHPTWILGMLLFLAILAAGFTGYLLPWDMKAFFATKVGAEVAATTPLAGEWIRTLMLGGDQVGTLTLTRFYAIHAVALPGVFLTLIVLHLFLVRRHGTTPRPEEHAQPSETAPSSRFFPDHAWKDALAALLAVAVLVILAGVLGAPLEDKADPSATGYVPRPEWYFLPLFQLLHYFDGPLTVLATAVLPGAAVTGLFLLPWLDRGRSSAPGDRKLIVALGGAGAAATLLLLVLALQERPAEPASSTTVLTVTARRTPSAPTSLRPGPAGVVPDHAQGVGAAATAGVPSAGEKLYVALRCAGCHEGSGAIGPDLSFAGSRWHGDWLANYLRAPFRVRWASMGTRPVARMPDFGLSQQESADLAAFLETRTAASRFPAPSSPPPEEAVAEGRQLFADYQCLGCHRLEGEGSDIGPALDGIGGKLTPGYLRAFLTKPGDIVPGTPMKEVELWPEEAAALTAYLSTLTKTSAQGDAQ